LKELISKLTWVDYLALIALLRGLYIGSISGVFHELLRVAAYAVTILATIYLFEPLAQYLTLHTFLNITSARAISFCSAFLIVYLAARGVRMLLVKLLKVGEEGALNRILGAAIGGTRLLVLLSFLFMGIDRSPLSQLKADIHTRSLTGAKIAEVAPTLVEFMSHLLPDSSSPKTDA
jgi:uncharacterized membrane protein required for colicin V production